MSESDVFFASLAQILRVGGHKLKSKLKPENIGLLLPGEFLPGHPRILKPQVALQVAEKSNHLYTWKEAGETALPRRKKSSLHSHLSRSVRPKNRCTFQNQEVFYSAWDTEFYQSKCEQVLQNEYYNQLENSLNSHNKKRQLSMKKIEINKRKKANDTRDAFYFPAFLDRNLDKKQALQLLTLLRSHVKEQFQEIQSEISKTPQLQLLQKTRAYPVSHTT